MKAVVDRVPQPLQEAHPRPGDLSLKETYGLLATLDEAVYLPQFRRMTMEDDPAFDPVDKPTLADDAWNEHPLSAILDRVQDARRRLLTFLHALPPTPGPAPPTSATTAATSTAWPTTSPSTTSTCCAPSATACTKG